MSSPKHPASRTLLFPAFATALAILLGGCGSASDNASSPSTDANQVNVEGSNGAPALSSHIFSAECVESAKSLAEEITNPDFALVGRNALGSAGDYLLANDQAAFVISGLGLQKTYYHYGGILIDAAPIQDCEQAGDEIFYELALMIAKASLTPTASKMRAFRGESIEIINDGADGNAAIVRVHGVDDTYWLAETVLMQESQLNDILLNYSEPMGLNITVDYILEPSSPTLKIEYKLTNKTDRFNSINGAIGLMAAGEAPLLNTFAPFSIAVDEFTLDYGIPWVSGTLTEANNTEPFHIGPSAYIYGEDTKHLAAAHVIGVDGLLNLAQVANTWLGTLLAPAGQDQDTLQQDFYVTVSKGDELDAVNAYLDTTPPSIDVVPTPVSITTQSGGQPLGNVTLEFQAKKQVLLQNWPWETFLTTTSDSDGNFSDSVPLISYLTDQPYRVIASFSGRHSPAAVALEPGSNNDINFVFEGQGQVAYHFVDEQGTDLPTQLSFWQGDQRIERFYLNNGQGILDIKPGTYDVGVSRGFEYDIVEKHIVVEAGVITPLDATLKRMVDTTGYLSFDAHVHTNPSADSTVTPVERLTTAAATGLEIVVSTDHEIITDLSPAIDQSGLGNWLTTVIGQEVTAALPNHTITYPIPVDPDGGPRGSPVYWYQLSLDEIFKAEKQRGGQIRTLAHPRLFILNALKWDRELGEPSIDTNLGLGQPEGIEMWSWDFEAMEYMNGVEKVFSTGLFDDWMSFLNHGQRITATGSSDMHKYQPPGMPRNYIKSPTDAPSAFDDQILVDAVTQNQVVVSTGAFARVLINGEADIGDDITDTDGTVDLWVHIEAIPQTDIDHFTIYVNCDAVMQINTENPTDSAIKYDGSLAIPIPQNNDAHIVVLGFGSQPMHRELPQYDPSEIPRFTTNPIFVDTNGDGQFTASGGKTCQHTVN
ncbi:hypothetical protein A9Q99_04180 [Gammaproteobacteria bacterium 45_16_T64]|nr:hypothetical protein A9Q99_04180 [Gammaproteobacteria bacterium 45_16_T64]